MVMRGVQKMNASTVTSVMLGKFHDDATTRREFLSLILSQWFFFLLFSTCRQLNKTISHMKMQVHVSCVVLHVCFWNWIEMVIYHYLLWTVLKHCKTLMSSWLYCIFWTWVYHWVFTIINISSLLWGKQKAFLTVLIITALYYTLMKSFLNSSLRCKALLILVD